MIRGSSPRYLIPKLDNFSKLLLIVALSLFRWFVYKSLNCTCGLQVASLHGRSVTAGFLRAGVDQASGDLARREQSKDLLHKEAMIQRHTEFR